MKVLRFIFPFLFLFVPRMGAQVDPPVSYGGMFDVVSLSLSSSRPLGNGNSILSVPFTSCSAGYFDVYFAAGMQIMNSTNATTLSMTRDNVCQVLTDISGFLQTYSLSSPGAPRINIYVSTAAVTGLVARASQRV